MLENWTKIRTARSSLILPLGTSNIRHLSTLPYLEHSSAVSSCSMSSTSPGPTMLVSRITWDGISLVILAAKCCAIACAGCNSSVLRAKVSCPIYTTWNKLLTLVALELNLVAADAAGSSLIFAYKHPLLFRWHWFLLSCYSQEHVSEDWLLAILIVSLTLILNWTLTWRGTLIDLHLASFPILSFFSAVPSILYAPPCIARNRSVDEGRNLPTC